MICTLTQNSSRCSMKICSDEKIHFDVSIVKLSFVFLVLVLKSEYQQILWKMTSSIPFAANILVQVQRQEKLIADWESTHRNQPSKTNSRRTFVRMARILKKNFFGEHRFRHRKSFRWFYSNENLENISFDDRWFLTDVLHNSPSVEGNFRLSRSDWNQSFST